jgi:peptidoglycan LD-endopeptidase CwlK
MRSTDKSLLCPNFSRQLSVFEVRLSEARLPFHLFEGLRTWDQQDELYAQGRTSPGNIVTNARGGDSWHNYGLACDYVLDAQPDKPGIQWSWDTRADVDANGHNDWRDMASIAVACGMESGFFWTRFPDLPHVQNRFGLSIADAKELYRLGGIQKVWAACKGEL